jgi:hypothetical protein
MRGNEERGGASIIGYSTCLPDCTERPRPKAKPRQNAEASLRSCNGLLELVPQELVIYLVVELDLGRLHNRAQ